MFGPVNMSPILPRASSTSTFGDVAHQICPLHGLKEFTPGILRAVARERSERKQVLQVTRGLPH